MSPRGWTPLLVGEEGEAARRAALSIADAILALDVQLDTHPSLASGRAGMALLEGYLARARPGQGHEERMARHLDKALDALALTQTGPSLYGGFTGAAWVLEHLRHQIADVDDDTNQVTDEALAVCLDGDPFGDHDLVNGLVGFGVYALERAPHPAGAALLERVLDHLAKTAVELPGGITWWTNAALVPSSTASEEMPQGWYNVGLAHGVPAVIALLAEMCGRGAGTARARPLLDAAVRWLLGCKLKAPAGAVFPHVIPVGSTSEQPPGRAAWCYGDPGISAALLLAARRACEPAWEAEALAIARAAARRPFETTGVRDAGICHGAAGLAHIFNRLFQATGEDVFREAAVNWLLQTLAMRPLGEGTGYRSFSWVPDDPSNPSGMGEGEHRWTEDPGLLTGATGVALVLLAAASPVEPGWDRMLMVNL